MLADEEYTRQKDKRKKRRGILQGLVLVTLLGICIDALFVFSRYRPYRPDQVKGVDRGVRGPVLFRGGPDRHP